MRIPWYGPVVAACLSFVGTVRADDAPPQGPRPLPKIDHPFLTWLTGTWDLKKSSPRPSLTATRTFGPGLDGTAVISETKSTDVGSDFRVLRVRLDGKSVQQWEFSDALRETGEYLPVPLSGPLSAAGYQVGWHDDALDLEWRLSRVGEDLVETALINGKPLSTMVWKRISGTRTLFEFAGGPLAGHALVQSLLGEWAVRIQRFDGASAEGLARFRLVADGEYLAHRSEAKGPGSSGVLCVWGIRVLADVPEDRTRLDGWSFTPESFEPLKLAGSATPMGWSASFVLPGAGPGAFTLRKTDVGFTNTMSLGGLDAITETWKRPAPPK